MIDISNTKNQHFIPRFLLKNFSWCINPDQKKKRQKFKTFFTGKDRKSLKRDINNIACADYFYEEEIQGEVEIEKQLSAHESRYARSLSIVLERSAIEKSQYDLISSFVFNLSWRTESNRVLMASIMKNGFEGVSEEMMDDKQEISRLQNNAFDDYVHRCGVNVDRNDKARFMAQVKPTLTADMRERMDYFQENQLPDLMKNFSSSTQSKLVTKNDISKHPVMSQMRWEICSVDSELILGDGGPIAFRENADESGPLFWMVASRAIGYIFLPLSHNKYLLGSPGSPSVKKTNMFSPKHTVDTLNRLSAEQGYNFYISKDVRSADMYSSLLGSTHSNYQNDWSIQSLKSS